MTPEVIVGALFSFHTGFRTLTSDIIMVDSLHFHDGFHTFIREVTGTKASPLSGTTSDGLG